MKKEKILLIIPAYNEAEGIVGVIEKVDAYREKSDYNLDYLVVNDGSTDNEEELLLLHQIKHVELVQNLGIGGLFKQATFMPREIITTLLSNLMVMDSTISSPCHILLILLLTEKLTLQWVLDLFKIASQILNQRVRDNSELKFYHDL